MDVGMHVHVARPQVPLHQLLVLLGVATTAGVRGRGKRGDGVGVCGSGDGARGHRDRCLPQDQVVVGGDEPVELLEPVHLEGWIGTTQSQGTSFASPGHDLTSDLQAYPLPCSKRAYSSRQHRSAFVSVVISLTLTPNPDPEPERLTLRKAANVLLSCCLLSDA